MQRLNETEDLPEALQQLTEENYNITIEYNNKFTPYNANVTKRGNEIKFKLSKKWKGVSKQIQIGLIQHLLIKILKIKKTKTVNTELYSTFLKNLHLSTEKQEIDEELEKAFNRVNQKYLNNLLETPNLKWGRKSSTQLATYNYHTDTIVISTIFKNEPIEVLEYVLYHEMLHKHLKFYETEKKVIYHSPKFKEMEKNFENQEQIEKQMQKIARKNKYKFWII